MVALLTHELLFPPVSSATVDGLVAVGGDLSIERLLLAYRSGIFPWPLFADDLMTWFSPNPRCILELDNLHVSRSLKKVIRKGEFELTIDNNFDAVIRACSEATHQRPTTWITEEIHRAYNQLHQAGHAHSVETWKEGQLVGGLYGVSIGGFFAGESMFSKVSNASKVALAHLVEHLRAKNFGLLDVQQTTPHLVSMGAHEIDRRVFMRRLPQALALKTHF